MAMVYAGYNDDYGNPVMVDDGSAASGTPTISWEDEYAKLIGISPNNDSTFSNANSPSNADILNDIGLGSSSLTNAINKLFGSNMTGKQLATLAGVAGGGLAGLMGALNPKVAKVGYQGGIPKYDAIRNMATAPTPSARPGAGGFHGSVYGLPAE